MSRPLFEITEEIKTLEQIVESFDQEIEGESGESSLLQWLDDLSAEQDKKIDAYAYVIRSEARRAAACKDEAKRLAERAKVSENAIGRLKDSIRDHMKAMKVRLLKTDKNEFFIKRNGGLPPVVIDNEAALPADCLTTPEPVPNKTIIRAKLDKGEVVPGARIGEYGESLVLK